MSKWTFNIKCNATIAVRALGKTGLPLLEPPRLSSWQGKTEQRPRDGERSHFSDKLRERTDSQACRPKLPLTTNPTNAGDKYWILGV